MNKKLIIFKKGFYLMLKIIWKSHNQKKMKTEEITCDYCGIMTHGTKEIKCPSCDYGHLRKKAR